MRKFIKNLVPRYKRQPLTTDRRERSYIVAYPKSGQTWLRVMLGRYMQLAYDLPKMPLFDGAETSLPEFAGYRGPALEFTHAPLTWDTQTAHDLTYGNVCRPFEKTPTIFLVRYPLDTLVSGYMQQKYQIKDGDAFTGDLTEYVANPVFGLGKLVRFHEIWACRINDPNQIFLLRYEDLIVRTNDIFKSLLYYLDLSITNTLVEEAVEFASFSNMKKMQLDPQQLRYPTSGLPIFGPTDLSVENSHHVRKGRPGGYKEEMPAEMVRRLEQEVGARMPAVFGYENPPRPLES